MRIPFRFHRQRSQRWVTAGARWLLLFFRQFAASLMNHFYRFFLWLRTVLLFLLWVSFEAEIRAWDWLKGAMSRNPQHNSGDWHRLVFCAAVSLTAVQLVFLFAGMYLSVWAYALCAGHGIAVHLFWEKGRRWSKRRAGLRPSRFIDPENKYGGLDLPS